MKQNMRYLMIEGTEVGTSIGEIQLYDENEEKVNLIAATDLGNAMIDELNLVPEKISYRNSMYFDEIKERYKLKKELCKKNNLSLEYIIYNENVEKRLDEIIKKYQYKTR